MILLPEAILQAYASVTARIGVRDGSWLRPWSCYQAPLCLILTALIAVNAATPAVSLGTVWQCCREVEPDTPKSSGRECLASCEGVLFGSCVQWSRYWVHRHRSRYLPPRVLGVINPTPSLFDSTTALAYRARVAWGVCLRLPLRC